MNKIKRKKQKRLASHLACRFRAIELLTGGVGKEWGELTQDERVNWFWAFMKDSVGQQMTESENHIINFLKEFEELLRVHHERLKKSILMYEAERNNNLDKILRHEKALFDARVEFNSKTQALRKKTNSGDFCISNEIQQVQQDEYFRELNEKKWVEK